MRLALITDEVGQDVEAAIRLGRDHGITDFAVRSAWGRNVAEFEEPELDRLETLLDRHRVRVSSVLSPLFKCHLPADGRPDEEDPHFVGFSRRFDDHRELPRRLAAIAARLGAPVLRLFSFLTAPASAPAHTSASAPEEWPARLDGLPALLPEGVTAGLENEHVCHVASLPDLRAFLSGPHGAGFGAVVDLSNHVLAGGTADPGQLTPDLVARAVDVHVKDRKDGRYVPVGTGTFDWPALLRRLDELGYDGPVTLESHLRGDEAGVRASLAALREARTW
ncbi:sugar phosphate isomerase/epimerase family protein [Streptomyces sp. NPDC048182]|uniref:sugar phosphate isomerase/epimerase family protein n=1 Tax=Streptomyces sp. NPDC048182 TaxID=3365507 RepID=UPI003718BC2D